MNKPNASAVAMWGSIGVLALFLCYLAVRVGGLVGDLEESRKQRDALVVKVAQLADSLEEANRRLREEGGTPVAKPPAVEGPQGPEGEPGPPGIQGPQGSEGPRGPKGERGPRGFLGGDGQPGEPGRAGTQGSRGVRGERGATGATGATGAAGEAGPQGPEGPPGPQGETGPAGPQGPEGPKGDQGPRGDQGPPPACAPDCDGTDGQDAVPFTFTFTVPTTLGSETYTCRILEPGADVTCE